MTQLTSELQPFADAHPAGTCEESPPFAFPRPDDDLVRNGRIMIVDDDEATTIAVRRVLHLAGFSRFELVTDSNSAFDEIRNLKPDIVLLDLMMPVNGVKILQRLRACKETARTAVLALTSRNDERTRSLILNLGANDFLPKPVGASELVARVRNTLSAKIALDRLASRSARFEADALQDALTGVANRRAFDFELKRKMLEWERQRRSVSLLLLDIDHFKRFNDRFGHPVGDLVLQQVTKAVQSSIRDMDLLCRIGGEEFAVVLPVNDASEAKWAAERIRNQVLQSEIGSEGHDVVISVSIGVATAMKGDNANRLIQRADTALPAQQRFGTTKRVGM